MSDEDMELTLAEQRVRELTLHAMRGLLWRRVLRRIVAVPRRHHTYTRERACRRAMWTVTCADGRIVTLFLISPNPKEAILRREPWTYRLEGVVRASQETRQASGLLHLGPFRGYRQAARAALSYCRECRGE